MSDQPFNEPQADSAVYLNNVSVKYRIPSEPIRTFKEYMIQMLKGRIKHHAFFALKNISMDVKQGEIFGILGRNGAGKSTLLKVVSKVLIPSEGRVWLQGHISPLLQLGAGFHPELTGLENIYLNAALLGHPREEVDQKLEEITSFAEIGEFIETPLRTYSSGMQARLGFAVATAWQPDILILDEVLAVGDIAFQNKCKKRMQSFRDGGATVLIVSHSVDTIEELCERAMWLHHGEIQAFGQTVDVCQSYTEFMHT